MPRTYIPVQLEADVDCEDCGGLGWHSGALCDCVEPQAYRAWALYNAQQQASKKATPKGLDELNRELLEGIDVVLECMRHKHYAAAVMKLAELKRLGERS